MTFADKDFVWFGQRRPDMPIVRWPDGTLCEPLIFFFGHLCKINHESISSMEPRAYTLREYFAFLGDEGITWLEADDLTLSRWRQHQLDQKIQLKQIEIKLRRVFHFYENIPDAMVFQADGSMTPEFVGHNKRRSPVKFPISTKIVTNPKTGVRKSVWLGSGSIKASKPELTVLSDVNRERVLTELRSPSSGYVGDDEYYIEPVIKRERDWSMGRLMAGSGLRAEEVPGVSLIDFTKALADEGLFTGLGRDRGRALRSVADLADDKEAQEIVLKALKQFETKQLRSYIGVRVIGKGSKERKAGFMIDLIYDLLTIVIWGGRAKLVKQWQSMDPNYNPEDTLFLSYKNKKEALTAGAVSDIMKKAFIRANVVGSGHDLRKNYATSMASMVLNRNLKKFGFFTHAVLNQVLDEVAGSLGHSKVTTLTQHYTNLAIVQTTGIDSTKKRKKIMGVWEMLLKYESKMDDERIRLWGTAAKMLAELPKNSELYDLFAEALEDPDLNPDGLIVLSKPAAQFPRLAVDNTKPRP